MRGLSVVVPCLALALAAIAWLAGLPLWAVVTTFFLVGPCAVAVAFVVQAAEIWRTPVSPAPEPPSPAGDAGPGPSQDGEHPCKRTDPP